MFFIVLKDGCTTINGDWGTNESEGRGLFMFARKDGHQLALDVPSVSLPQAKKSS